jgi:hypothetical protein
MDFDGHTEPTGIIRGQIHPARRLKRQRLNPRFGGRARRPVLGDSILVIKRRFLLVGAAELLCPTAPIYLKANVDQSTTPTANYM